MIPGPTLADAKKVWLIALVDYDQYDLKHICLSKETALKRFDEVRRQLIKDNEGMIAHDIEEGIDPADWVRTNKILETWTPESQREGCSGETPQMKEWMAEP